MGCGGTERKRGEGALIWGGEGRGHIEAWSWRQELEVEETPRAMQIRAA